MTLTEQYKKGKLEFGKKYYVRFEDGEIGTAQWCYYTNQDRYGFDVDEVKEVLAPVPSYEEWRELSKQRNRLIRDINGLAYIQEENQQLKELLKECRGFFIGVNTFSRDNGCKKGVMDSQEWITKIDNAIGEKK